MIIILIDCGDVRSRTSYNNLTRTPVNALIIVVTSDLGRVTTIYYKCLLNASKIVVTSDLGRVTTLFYALKDVELILW